MITKIPSVGTIATLSLVLIASILAPRVAVAQEPVTIDAPVSTAFGVYSPLAAAPVRPESGLSEPTVAAGFSNVATAGGRFPWNNFFSQSERSILERNSFVVRPEAFGSFGELYNKSTASQEVGSFVTVDAVLHGLRVTVAEAERRLERDYMAPTLESLLGTLSRTVAAGLGAERDPRVVASYGRVLAYVETARALLDPSLAVNTRVRDAVDQELGRIRSASGVATSSILPERRIDYSIFAPVGHYRLDESFGNYYRARTWLGSVGLSLRDADGEIDADDARMTALLARAIDVAASQENFAQRYHDLYELAAFLGGRSESDISWEMMTGALSGYYGRMIGTAASSLAADSTVVAFSHFAESQFPASRDEQRFFRLLPSTTPRGIVDRLGSRLAPSTVVTAGIFSTVGAADARAATSLRGTLASRVKEDWMQSLDWALLYTLQPLVASNAESNGYPRFARGEAWRTMRTASALGAWAAYQHPLASASTKAIRVGSSGGGGTSDLATPGYVEPTPEGWARVASLAGFLRSGFASARYNNALGRELETRLRDIENVSAQLMQIAAAEIGGRDLSSDQLALIGSMKSRIAAYETFADKSLTDGSPIVAGIGRGSGAIPATGHPLALYVVVPRNDGVGGLMLTRGAVYSYYEVTTDPSTWMREMTSAGGDVRPAAWTQSYLAIDRGVAQDARKFQAVESALPATASYVPTKEEKKLRQLTVDLDMEANTVRSSAGELWYTVRAPELNGVDIMVTVLNTAGREVYRTTPARIEGGKRYDVIRVEELQPGQYFIRVTDYTDRTLASGRFLVVR